MEWTTISITLAFQYNFCLGIVLGDQGAVSHQKYVLCGHTCPWGHIMKNQGYSVLTIYTGKPEIQVGKSNGPHHFIWEASENMGCDLRRSDAINLFFYPFQSVQLIWIYFVVGHSPTTSNLIDLFFCTRFPPRWFV